MWIQKVGVAWVWAGGRNSFEGSWKRGPFAMETGGSLGLEENVPVEGMDRRDGYRNACWTPY